MSETITTTTALGNVLVDQVMARMIWDAAYQNTVISPYVQTEIVEGRESASARFSVWLPASMATFTEANGMNVSALSADKLDIAAVPHGLAFEITGELESLQSKAIPQAALQGGLAAAESLDTDLALLFPAFTGLVTSTTTMTKADWLSAIAKLNKKKAPMTDRIGILSTKQYQDLLNDASVNIAVVNALANTVRDGRIGPLYGVEPLQTALTTTAVSGAKDVGGMFHRQTLGCTVSRTLRVRSLFLPVKDVTQVATTFSYGVGMVRPDWGVCFESNV